MKFEILSVVAFCSLVIAAGELHGDDRDGVSKLDSINQLENEDHIERQANEPATDPEHTSKWQVLMRDMQEKLKMEKDFKKSNEGERSANSNEILKRRFIKKLIERWQARKKDISEENDENKNDKQDNDNRSNNNVNQTDNNDDEDGDEDETDKFSRLVNQITEGLIVERDEIKLMSANLKTLNDNTNQLLDMMASVSFPVDESVIRID